MLKTEDYIGGGIVFGFAVLVEPLELDPLLLDPELLDPELDPPELPALDPVLVRLDPLLTRLPDAPELPPRV